HSRLDADFYRAGARVTPAARHRIQRWAKRKLTPAPWRATGPLGVPRGARGVRFAGRTTFVEKLTAGRATKGALEQFLTTCAAENPNRRLRMMALADRGSMGGERAAFRGLAP